MPIQLSSDDLSTLTTAKQALENPGLAARVTDLIGTPIEKGFELLPEKWRGSVGAATNRALSGALSVALRTVDRKGTAIPNDGWHKLAAGTLGGVAGAFGLVALPIELPITTAVMLRSIAEIARSEGEDLDDPVVGLACIEVFALGGGSSDDDAAESGYFVTRALLARSITEAAEFIAERGVIEESAPAIVRFIAAVASRFGITVSEKAAAMAVPIVGAAGGALINALFMDHFQDMAHGHFAIRRLERKYGQEAVRITYERIGLARE